MTGVAAMCFSSGLHFAAQVLLLAWKMGAARMGYFSRREFMMGVRALNAPSLDKLRKVLPKLDKDIDEDEDSFSSFFAFAFKFCLMVSQRHRSHSCTLLLQRCGRPKVATCLQHSAAMPHLFWLSN